MKPPSLSLEFTPRQYIEESHPSPNAKWYTECRYRSRAAVIGQIIAEPPAAWRSRPVHHLTLLHAYTHTYSLYKAFFQWTPGSLPSRKPTSNHDPSRISSYAAALTVYVVPVSTR